MQKVILFGSLASGSVGIKSDLDLLIVQETEKAFLSRLMELTEHIDPDLAVDILVYTPQEFAEIQKNQTAFFNTSWKTEGLSMKNNSTNEGLRWLAQSQSDLADARYLSEGSRFNACCFFCHQAAEKALKAYLYKQGAEHVYGHSVAELCQEAAGVDRAFADIKAAVSPLDVFCIPTRYPNGLPGGIPSEAFTREGAERALASKMMA